MPTEDLFNKYTIKLIPTPKLEVVVTPSRDTALETVNNDVEQLYFGETLPSKTFFSRAVFSYDVPEVENLQASFVYNYFTADERVRRYLTPEEQMVNIDAANTSDIMYQVKNDKLPRYVKFSFSPRSDPYAKLSNTITTVVRDNLDSLIVEGAGSTKFHTGVELLDTNLEKTVYKMLSGSFTFINSVSEKDSPLSAAGKLEEELNEKGGLTGQSKKLLLESMSTMQPEGLSFAPTDVPLEIAQTSDDPITKQTFSLKINNLFIGDVFRRASRIPDRVFQDEIETLRRIGEGIQQAVGQTIDPETVSDAEFENFVNAIDIRPFNNLKDNTLLTSNHEITQLGYIIQRTEILPDETAINLAPLYSDNPQSLYVIDKNVRYGGVYVYKIRTVCKVKSLVRDTDGVDGTFDDLAIVEFLMVSEGVTTSVHCTESVPPPPPTRLKASLHHIVKKPVLTWQFPLNVQRDIKRFQIFKRSTIQQPFTLIAEYDFDDSHIRTEPIEVASPDRVFRFTMPRLDFLDNEYTGEEKVIYAISCVDAHGYSSHLSAQLEVQFKKFENRIITRVVSGEGAPKPYPNLLLEEDAFKDAMKVSGYDRMTVFLDPEYYRVVKNVKKQIRGPSKKDPDGLFTVSEVDQNFLMVNPNEPTYKIQILNVDLQADEIVNITIADKSGPPISVPAANISENNINFEFGVD